MNDLVTHSCGHQERHLLTGLFAAEREQHARRLGYAKCTDCKREASATRASQHNEAVADLALPALTGSDKQVAWAGKFRAERLAKLRKDDPALPDLAGILEAKWWIEHRSDDLKRVVKHVQAARVKDSQFDQGERGGGRPVSGIAGCRKEGFP